MKLTKTLDKMNLTQMSNQRAEYVPRPYRFRQAAAVQLILIGIVLALSSVARAEVTLRKIGEPMFNVTGGLFNLPVGNPSGGNHAEVWGQNVKDFLDGALPEHHFNNELTSNWEDCYSCPLEAHDGPYEQEFQRSLVEQGILLTDAFLLDDFAYPTTLRHTVVLTPNSTAPDGRSLDNANGPTLPSSMFPVARTGISWKANGRTVGTLGRAQFGALDIQQSPEDADEELDYTGLNYSHFHIPLGYHSPSRPRGFATNLFGQVGNHEAVGTVLDANGNGWEITSSITVVREPTDVAGDINYNGELDLGDLNIMTRNVSLIPTDGHELSEDQLRLDMNGDQSVDVSDVHHWVTELKGTWIGDANLDGEFNSTDFIEVFQAGKYESGESARWNEGDWNSDARFDSADFIAAFQDGGYEMGARSAVAAVPEPASWFLVSIGLLGVGRIRRR